MNLIVCLYTKETETHNSKQNTVYLEEYLLIYLITSLTRLVLFLSFRIGKKKTRLDL